MWETKCDKNIEKESLKGRKNDGMAPSQQHEVADNRNNANLNDT